MPKEVYAPSVSVIFRRRKIPVTSALTTIMQQAMSGVSSVVTAMGAKAKSSTLQDELNEDQLRSCGCNDCWITGNMLNCIHQESGTRHTAQTKRSGY